MSLQIKRIPLRWQVEEWNTNSSFYLLEKSALILEALFFYLLIGYR